MRPDRGTLACVDADTKAPLSSIREHTVISGSRLAIVRGDFRAIELRAR